MALHRAGQTYAKRLRGKLQRQDAGRDQWQVITCSELWFAAEPGTFCGTPTPPKVDCAADADPLALQSS